MGTGGALALEPPESVEKRFGAEQVTDGRLRSRPEVHFQKPQGSFYGQAERAISNGELHTLLYFHLRPIHVLV